MDPAAVAGVEEAEQATFPAAAAAEVVSGIPVPASVVASPEVESERGVARVLTHVASTAAREATGLAPGAAAASASASSAVSAAAVAAASSSAVIRQILRRGILSAATYPAAVHHLRVLIT